MVVTRDGLGTIAKLTGGLAATEFDEMAIGNGATAGNSPSETDNALATETQRDTDVTGTVETTNFTDDTMRFVGTFTFSSDQDVTEFGVFNGATTDIMLLRQIFSETLNVENNDTLDITVDVVTTVSSNNDTDGTRPETLISQAGVANTNELCVADVTDPANGAFTAMALGLDDGTQLAAADDNTRLGDEFIGAGLSRQSATVTQETTNVSGANGGGDTTRFNASFTATATVNINEVGVFDTATSPSDDGDGDNATTNASGEMLFRHIFDEVLNFVSNDTLDMTVDVVNSN